MAKKMTNIVLKHKKLLSLTKLLEIKYFKNLVSSTFFSKILIFTFFLSQNKIS